MIDIHSHLLPAVDDGSPSVDVSVAVLRRFHDEGVKTVVCTPHLNASEAEHVAHADYLMRLGALADAVGGAPALRLGFEVMLDVPGADLTAPHLTLGGSTALLVEFPRGGLPPGAGDELHRLRMSGVVPVVAHPERYRGCTLDHVRQWRRAGAVIQTDGMMLLGGGWGGELAREMLAEGLIDCVASDNHGDSRSLAGVKRWLVELGSPVAARLLTYVNPERVLADEPPLPVPPVTVSRGLVARLRGLMRGGRRP